MVKGDIGNDRSAAHDRICGVQPAAETGFPDDHIHPGAAEDQRRKNSGELKVGKVAPFGGFGKFFPKVVENIFRHRFAVDPEPFTHIYEMGRGVESRGKSGTAEGVFQHGSCGTFAVGSRKVDEFQISVRVPRTAEQLIGGVQPQTDAEHVAVIQIICCGKHF